MTSPDLANAAARALAEHDPVPTSASAETRAKHLAAMEVAIRRRHRRVIVQRWSVGAAAAAALIVGGAWVDGSFFHSSATDARSVGTHSVVAVAHGAGVVVTDGTNTRALGADATLQAGESLRTPTHASTALSFATGTRIDVREESEFAISSLGAMERFQLRRGSMHARVAPLHAGERFVINTSDAEVEVHGTSFRVDALSAPTGCEVTSSTRVVVDEGVVSVRHAGVQVFVRAGSSWPTECAPSAAHSTEAPATTPASGIPVTSHHLAHANVASPSVEGVADTAATDSTSTTHASTLALENDAFADAVALRREHRTGEALAAFERFVAEHPRSLLVESARIEAMRLLRDADRTRAESMARDYLRQYPDGVARREAEDLLASP